MEPLNIFFDRCRLIFHQLRHPTSWLGWFCTVPLVCVLLVVVSEKNGTNAPPPTLPCNGDDLVVNGRNDLVNLCPFAVDLTRLFEAGCSVRTSDVHDMYRWVNLYDLLGVAAGAKFASRDLVSWPDSEHADANVVFVHGYNMHPQEAWDWSQAMFKRLWWAGMDAGFTAVLWRGNHSQHWLPGKNCYATLNYHPNVLNAFRTAGSFEADMALLPGRRKYIIAHSLGNMLVSAARQDYGLAYEKYFMLNAAVPVEAYDAAGGVTLESRDAMTPPVWRSYDERLQASYWHNYFGGSTTPADVRRHLTWKGRFADVDNVVNFYSSEDEVVANGDDSVFDVLTRNYAWYNQEKYKGSYLVSLEPEAGWAFNPSYDTGTVVTVVGGFPIVVNGVIVTSFRNPCLIRINSLSKL